MVPYCHAEAMGSEETMFTLYTSCSTGKPKGVVATVRVLVVCGDDDEVLLDLRDDDVPALRR